MKLIFQASIVLLGIVNCGCTVRSVSVGYGDDSPSYRNVYVDHVCSYDCCDHYWNGDRIVVIESGHRHYRGCGHRWTGRYWVIEGYDEPDVVISKAPAHRIQVPQTRVRSVTHVHSATCGCAWDRRDRVWVVVEEGHVHGRNCGHINVTGKWCLPR